MSFILDALKKAEHRRGPVQPATPADTPLGDMAAPQPARTLPVTAIALAAGIVAIAAAAWWAGRHSGTPVVVGEAAPPAPVQLPVDDSQREIRPLNREVEQTTRPAAVRSAPGTVVYESAPAAAATVTPGVATAGAGTAPQASPGTPFVSPAAAPARNSALLTYEQMVLSGRVQLPTLHLDIHVYAAAPEKRFVFVNNRKYRQGQKLDEGGSVEDITPTGVVLNFRGHRFELVPD